ncbi:MAG: FAD-dependent thymidylate synthase, partial [Ilumatobacteraceae bacterium]
MSEAYQATILADSISPDGVRLTTLWVTFPRFILAEVNTHRMLSRNSNSSRAIPPERQIEKVRTNPFVPETFNKRVTGMGVGDPLERKEAAVARGVWLDAAEFACDQAEQLLNLDCDKSRINRLLEPFLWHSAVISATEWDNFFALRDHPAAQPEFRILAKMMKTAMTYSSPVKLPYTQWHLPGVAAQEIIDYPGFINWEMWKLVSVGRLARWTS